MYRTNTFHHIPILHVQYYTKFDFELIGQIDIITRKMNTYNLPQQQQPKQLTSYIYGYLVYYQ